jgi:hypothetical protein
VRPAAVVPRADRIGLDALPLSRPGGIPVPGLSRGPRGQKSFPDHILSDIEDRNSFSRLLYRTNGRAPLASRNPVPPDTVSMDRRLAKLLGVLPPICD